MALADREKKMVSFLGAAAVGYLIYSILIPMKETYDKRLIEIDAAAEELKNAHMLSRNMVRLERDLQKTQLKLEELKKKLPEQVESLDIVNDLTGLARKVEGGLKIGNISFGQRSLGAGWEAIPFRITFTAAWFQFIKFLWLLESYDYVIDVTAVSLGPSGTVDGGVAKIQLYNINMSASIYANAGEGV